MTYTGKTVLVTGGTGSFGNYIVNRVLGSDVKELRVFSRDEKKQYDMKQIYRGDDRLKFFIGDIRDAERIDEAMNGVDIVYQAAALKHVPVCETAPFEAVQTNVVGVENVIRASLKHRVEKLVCLSTDKAVKPVNVMGMTKALQERLVLAANHSPSNQGTKLCVVRYGNVVLSRGSVIPFFRRLLERGQQLTITDEAMTRFLLTLDDAIDLVVFATENSRGGEVFVKKAPAANIMTLAKILSAEAGKSLDFKVIGKFPGEKIHEILITEEELERTEDHGDFLTIHPSWDESRYTDVSVEYSSGEEVVEDEEQVRSLLRAADEADRSIQMDNGEMART